MASPAVTSRLQLEFKIDAEALNACLPFLEGELSPAFLARYESESIGGIDEETLRALRARLESLQEIERRKESMIKTLEESGKMNAALKNRIESTFDRAKLEDYYRPFRPWKQNQAAQAVACGLTELARRIATGDLGDQSLEDLAQEHVESSGLPNAEAVLETTSHLIAQWIADDPYVRAHVREEMRKRGRFVSKVVTQDAGLRDKYKDVQKVNDLVNQIPPQRYYALRRAEREKAVRVDIDLAEDGVLEWMDKRFLDGERGSRRRRRKGAEEGGSPAEEETADLASDAESAGSDAASEEAPAPLEVTSASPVTADSTAEEPSSGAKTTEEAGYDVTLPGDDPPSKEPEEAGSSAEEGRDASAASSDVPFEPASGSESPQEATPDSSETPTGETPSGPTSVPAAEHPEAHAAESSPASAPDKTRSVTQVEAPDPPSALKEPLQGPVREYVAKAVREAYQRQIFGACEIDIRTEIKEKADHEYLRMLARILRGFLLTPPYGAKPMLAVDPGLRNNSKFVVVDRAGKFVNSFPLPLKSDEKAEESRATFKSVVAEHEIAAVAVGNGTQARQVGVQLRKWIDQDDLKVDVVVVDEAGLQHYATSKECRARFADLDTRSRTALCLALRLQNPLHELLHIDPRHYGFAPFQNDVGRARLQRIIDDACASAVNRVGVDLDTAGADLLRWVAGIDRNTAQAIVTARDEGKVRTLADLEPILGAENHRAAVGFLRFHRSEQPLDRTALIPEWFPLAEKVATDNQVPMADLVGNAERVRSISFDAYQEEFGERLCHIVSVELERPWRDPRGPWRRPRFERDLTSIEEVREGMEIEGVVTNLTSFGVFVDLGIQQEGLVHISEMGRRFVRDPRELLRVGDVIRVGVMSVERDKERIGLTMRPMDRGMRAKIAEQARQPRRQPRKDRGPVRAATARRDGLVTGREDDGRERRGGRGGRGEGGRGRSGPGRSGPGRGGPGQRGGGGSGSKRGDRQGSGRGGPRQGRSEGRGGGRRFDRDEEAAMSQAPEVNRPGWNPFKSFFETTDETGQDTQQGGETGEQGSES